MTINFSLPAFTNFYIREIMWASKERELSFLNLILVRNDDAKISVSFVTRCGFSVLLRSFALFVFKVRFGPNDFNFLKAVCVNP